MSPLIGCWVRDPKGPDAPRPLNCWPFVPHIGSWEPCGFTEAPDGPHTYTLNILWYQGKGAQMRMSE
jgi:hypothetical protein